MPYKNGTPSHDTIGRVMGLVSPDALENMFSGWMEAVSRSKGVIAIDGKTARGARGPDDKMALVHMVSAFSSANGLVLGQLKTDEKSNEITAIPRLLEALHLTGATVTLDAGGCHAKIMDAIKKRNADFVIAIKENQQTRLEDCSVAFHDADRQQTGRAQRDRGARPRTRRAKSVRSRAGERPLDECRQVELGQDHDSSHIHTNHQGQSDRVREILRKLSDSHREAGPRTHSSSLDDRKLAVLVS